MNKGVLLKAGLSILVIASRIPFRAHIPYGLDSIQFVLALQHYDVRIHQPHPPGYYLFVKLGSLFSLLFHDANLSFIAANVLFSVLAIIVFYRLGQSLLGARAGMCATLLLASCPVFWFHGEVALSNAVDCFFTCLVAWLCWQTLNEQPRALYYSALALGLSGGVRQNTLVFLLPLWVFSIARSGIKKQLIALFLLGATVASWYLPMSACSGGIRAYQTALRDHWLNAGWHGYTFAWIPFNFLCVSSFILLGTGLGFLFVVFGMLFWMEHWRHHIHENPRKLLFLTLWLAPSLGFFVLVYSHPVQTGHSLMYLPAFMLLLPGAAQITCEEIWRLWALREEKGAGTGVHVGNPGGINTRYRTSESHTHHRMMGLAVSVLIVSNCYVFLGMNTAVSRARIRDYETKVADMIASIRSQCPPSQTILVNSDFMFLGFRDLMYHLPEYHTIQPRIYSLTGETRLFSGYHGQTQLSDHVDIPSQVRYFLLNADEFVKNPGLIRGLNLENIPADHLLKTQTGVRWYRGQVQDLPVYFPGIHFVFNGKTGSNDTFGTGALALPLD
ncbi:MAG TPA: glycosyltransferase family 39 protein [Terriglobia bacterium]|nr:glycosyltransferase family 39 protein [Terriglobia bacterium]